MKAEREGIVDQTISKLQFRITFGIFPGNPNASSVVAETLSQIGKETEFTATNNPSVTFQENALEKVSKVKNLAGKFGF